MILGSLPLCREQELVDPASDRPAETSIDNILKKSISAWKTYAHQEVFLAAVALALLYFTVMSFVSLPSPLHSNY